jgi:NAD(P)-dependent dehydrogenase (short-subunit alcohol dehydrogenase family)
MESGLGGRTVLITGGAMGIGRACAEAELHELAAGLRDGGTTVSTAAADLSTREGVEAGIDEALAGHGDRLDVLVNNVGTGYVRGFDDLTDDDWKATLELNFFSYVRAIRAVLPRLRAQGSGVIVNNASDLAKQPEANPIDYSVSKSAVLALTKGLARSEGPAIRVNAVAPGPVWTPFWTKPGGFADTLSEMHGRPPQEAVEYELSLRQMPMNRLGRPEEVANVVVFLASDLAGFVTSSVYSVDGGTVRSLF